MGRRGTPPIDIAPKREFYIHHTVTSNHCRTRAEERQHMRDLEQARRSLSGVVGRKAGRSAAARLGRGCHERSLLADDRQPRLVPRPGCARRAGPARAKIGGMSARIATGLARTDAGVDSFAEAASRAALQLGGAPADLAVVFAGAANLGHADEGLAAVQDRLHARALLGCGAQGVVGDGRELEEGGVVVWAASLPGAEVETFYLETVPTSETAVAVAGMPELDGADAAIVLVDPYTFPIGPVLAQLADDQPGLPVVGGLASAGGGPRMAVLMHDDEVARRGAVGVALSSVDVRVCVSQGARPIGPEMAITAAEGNVIHELASQQALERLRTAIAELDPGERALASQGLLLGIVIDPTGPSTSAATS
jgi:small ligand-binding sensory domain FIST